MKRSFTRSMISRLRSARPRIAWCMVGTAVNQLGRSSSIQRKKRSASKPGVQTTVPPARSDPSTAAISPWMWNSGMTLRQTSAGASDSAAAMLAAEAVTFACVSGTIFGRAVVPEVCSTSATSSGCAMPGRAARPGVPPSSVKDPAGPSGTTSSSGTPSFAAAARAGVSTPRITISALARRSSM